MGTILLELKKRPIVSIERQVDDIEIQKLTFRINDGWISEENEYVHIFGRDEDYNTIDISLRITVNELKEALYNINRKVITG